MSGEQIIWPNAVVAEAFGNPWIGFVLALALIAAALAIIAYNYFRHYQPTARALDARVEALGVIAEKLNDYEAQEAFVAHYDEIDAAMLADGRSTAELRHAWTQFSETIVDKSETPLRATMRPEGYFLHLGDDTRVLAWWANIFVAAGLTLTFLGIIAALVGAVTAMSGGADMTRMEGALVNLLTITAAKFWTSIGGVGASIILRWVDRRWHSRTDRRLETICDRLEYGTLFSPPQRIAMLQLRQLEQQSVAMTEFSQQLAASIGDALERNMAPVVAGLGGIQKSLNDFREGGFSEIGKNVGEKINEHAGAQMEALAVALGQMTVTLDRVTSGLDGASAQASDQIAEAAKQFANASDEMLRAVRELVETARAENGAAMKESLADFAVATGEIRSAFDGMRVQIAQMGEGLTSGASDAAQRNADVLASAARALETATAGAHAGLTEALNDAIARSADESGRAISAAFAAFGERFDAASGKLVDVLRDTAGQMAGYAGAIERSTGAASDHASKLADAGREAQAVSAMLGRAANDVSEATAPIRDAAVTIRETVGHSQELLRRAGETSDRQRAAMEAIAGTLERTGTAASEAWENYRNRFTEVDEALGKALEQIRGASSEHATALNAEVGRIDHALADAANKLGAALEPLAELGQSLEDVLGRLHQQQAAE